jgi:glycosyltransferase involved in cell wall biosynthesis
MNNSKISIIIPVYNVGLYVNECIDSIINQTYGNIEIIIVDDGSTDDSPEIVDYIALKDDRIKVIHQKNKGLSEARNTGIKVATGEYIGFIDSDDRIKPNMYELLVDSIQQNDADLSICNFLRFSKNLSIISNRYDDKIINYKNKNTTEFYEMIIDSSCNKLYKSEIVRRYNIYFEDKSIVPQEDFYFLLKYFTHINKVVTISNPLYEYRIRKSSITNSKQPEGFYQGSIRFVDKISEYHFINNINREIENFELHLFINMMKSCINNVNQNAIKEIVNIFKLFSKHRMYKSSIQRYLDKEKNREFSFRKIYNISLFILLDYNFINTAALFESLRVRRLRRQSKIDSFYE